MPYQMSDDFSVLTINSSTTPEEFKAALKNLSPVVVKVQDSVRTDVQALLPLAQRLGIRVEAQA
ncbi:hypothetical protein GCM10008019_29040 [Deinococcus soli (ex Cha et al. 2016)]|nr:hypothetical protein GCM10008019_29040 [Deinococcus soli (ex Cha et al. 2016)]